MRKSLLCGMCVFIAIILAFSLLLVGCTASESPDDSLHNNTNKVNNERFEGRFIPIFDETINFNGYLRDPTVRYFYDKHTKVVYFYFVTSEPFGLQPLYNADGSLVVYKD